MFESQVGGIKGDEQEQEQEHGHNHIPRIALYH